MSTIIRPATSEDIPALARLVGQFWPEHSRMIGGNRSITEEECLAEVSGRLSQADSGYFLALNEGGEIVGYRSWELSGTFYTTCEMFVIPTMRRRGIAAQLIERFERWLTERGQDIACISITPHNSAMLKLLVREGYTILNKIEFRKDLSPDARAPRGTLSLFDFEWNVL